MFSSPETRKYSSYTTLASCQLLRPTSRGIPRQHRSHTTRSPDAMAVPRPAEPTFQGLSGEIRNMIYDFVAADGPDKRIILGRKLVEASKDNKHDGDICEQAFSALVSHPLSMSCTQIRREYLSRLRAAHTSAQLNYDFVINNFDPEQLKATPLVTQMRLISTHPGTHARASMEACLYPIALAPRTRAHQTVRSTA